MTTKVAMANRYLQMDNRICLERQNKTNDQVTELILDYCQASQITGLTDEFINLEALSMINVGLNTLDGFPRLPRLKKLELCDNKITDGLGSLLGCPNLQELNLAGNCINDFSALEPLKDLHVLASLDVFNCEITKLTNYRQKILDLLPNLQMLDGFDRNQRGLFESDRSEDEGVYEGSKMNSEPTVMDSDSMDLEECRTISESRGETNSNDVNRELQTVSTKDVHPVIEVVAPVAAIKMREDLSATETKTLDSSGAVMSEQVTVVEVTKDIRLEGKSIDQKAIEQEMQSEEHSDFGHESKVPETVHHSEDTPKSPEQELQSMSEKAVETGNETFDKTYNDSSYDASTESHNETAQDSLVNPVHESLNQPSFNPINEVPVEVPKNDLIKQDVINATVETPLKNVSDIEKEPESAAEVENVDNSMQAENSEQQTKIADLAPMQAPSYIVSSDVVEPDSAANDTVMHDKAGKVADDSEIQVVNISADQDSDSESESESDEEEDEDEEANVNSSKELSFEEGENMEDEEDEGDYLDDEDGDNEEELGQLSDRYCGYSSITPEEIEEGECVDDEDDDVDDEDEMPEDGAIDRTVELVESDDAGSGGEEHDEKSS